jgi:hypothetical protein
MHHSTSTPELGAVVVGHWIAVAGIEIIDADAVATVIAARTVQVTASA